MPGNKAKGSKCERELFELFVANGYRAVRVAGSGTMENAECDLIAGKKGKKFAIEAKSSKKTTKYISKKQINDFMIFSENIYSPIDEGAYSVAPYINNINNTGISLYGKTEYYQYKNYHEIGFYYSNQKEDIMPPI